MRPRQWTLLLVGVPIVGIVGAFAFYTFMIDWQVRQVEQLCKEIRPGTPVANIRPAIEKHHLWNGLVAYQFEQEGGKGSYTAQTKLWDYAVPASLTMGDTECFISHNGSVVVGTQVMY